MSSHKLLERIKQDSHINYQVRCQKFSTEFLSSGKRTLGSQVRSSKLIAKALRRIDVQAESDEGITFPDERGR